MYKFPIIGEFNIVKPCIFVPQTLRAITKFSAQDMYNRNVLFNLNAIRYILPHVEHPELNIKRFALKALAQLCQLPRGPEQVLANSQNLRKIAYMLVKVRVVLEK